MAISVAKGFAFLALLGCAEAVPEALSAAIRSDDANVWPLALAAVKDGMTLSPISFSELVATCEKMAAGMPDGLSCLMSEVRGQLTDNVQMQMQKACDEKLLALREEMSQRSNTLEEAPTAPRTSSFIAVGTAGLHRPAPDRSGHCRTSSASSRSQWALPDFNRELQIPVSLKASQFRMAAEQNLENKAEKLKVLANDIWYPDEKCHRLTLTDPPKVVLAPDDIRYSVTLNNGFQLQHAATVAKSMAEKNLNRKIKACKLGSLIAGNGSSI
eukprot:s1098_g17.t1